MAEQHLVATAPTSWRRALLCALAIVLTVLGAAPLSAQADPTTAAAAELVNGTAFRDTAGRPIQAHGAGVIQVGSFYYLLGENRNPDNSFRAVSMYRSTNLVDWEFRNDILTQNSAAELNVSNIERPKVVYDAGTRRFVLWMHWENGRDYTQARVAVAESETVDGAYRYRGSFRPLGYDSRDMTVFVDRDGTGYLFSATRVNADLNVYRLTDDLTGVQSLVSTLWPGRYREAPAVFERGGTYFMVTSGATGWDPNQARYATAPSPTGPWTEPTDVADNITYGSQSTFVLPVTGTSGTSFLYLGDRWAGAWGGPVNDSEYVWLPLRFPSPTSLAMDWSPRVAIDAAAGSVVGVGSGRPYTALVARHSGRCADVVDGSRADGAAIIQYGCHGRANQQWQIRDAGSGTVRLVNRGSHRCLDVLGASTADGAEVRQYGCNGGVNQRFTLRDGGSGTVQIVAAHSGRCLDVVSGSGADGARIVQFTCGTGDNQRWTLPGAARS